MRFGSQSVRGNRASKVNEKVRCATETTSRLLRLTFAFLASDHIDQAIERSATVPIRSHIISQRGSLDERKEVVRKERNRNSLKEIAAKPTHVLLPISLT